MRAPAAFANGRYRVERLLGEGGKKRVYLAHDTLLDRDVAFALIETEGLDGAGRERIRQLEIGEHIGRVRPDLERRIIGAATHNVHRDQPDVVNAAIIEFLMAAP